jgi:hypothetical protein
VEDEIRVVPVLVQVALAHDHDVDGKTETTNFPRQDLVDGVTINLVCHDDQSIQVAVRSHLTARGRAEQDDPERMYAINHATHQLLDNGGIGTHGSFSIDGLGVFLDPQPTRTIYLNSPRRRQSSEQIGELPLEQAGTASDPTSTSIPF